MEPREKRLVFPFSAIVGQEKAKLALLAVAVNPLIGGVLLKGDKGTGKSTLVRALANVLPEIEVVADCPFNCNPKNPLEMCDSCYERYENGEELPIAKRKMRVVDLPLSVTIDRLVGTVDVERFLKEGKKALQPGILAEANRGVLYIDEVNLLDDYIADSLLDAAAMGWNTIEREGISFRHPARFILVGSMNPEEGELRPQILDRFGLCVEVSASMNPEERIEIVKRVEEFHEDLISFYKKYESEEKKLTERIVKAREILPEVEISDDLLKLLAETVVNLGIKTNRAEIATIKTAKAIAALNGRRRVSLEDLEKAMELALPHRLRDRPFQKPPQMRPPKPKDDSKHNHDHKGDHKHEHKKEEKSERRNQESRSQGIGNLEQNFRSSEAKIPRIESKNFDGSEFTGYRSSRDVSVTVVNFPKGIPVSYVPPKGEIRDVDFYNSVICAMLNGKKPPIKLDLNDLRVRVRKAKAPTLWVLLLDSSGSMAVQKRISIAKGIAEKLVENGYIKKSKMALIVAKGNQAEIFVPPTKNYWEVLEKIESVPTGGRTPLSSALYNLLLLANRERMKDRSVKVRAFLITDGKANVPLFGKRIKEEITELARVLKKREVELTVYDTRGRGINPGLSYVPILEQVAGAKVHKV
ncbi:VWA domain-containing protein [Thermococcus sp. GR7]|uniref:VWA domain-containing protein n=1 Tax=unclassified Thermococcus TaxID=2627626 RepID=UPI001432074C|nr:MULTISPECIES: VWA domain-containing protein [unclassified Thermococcus]NJE45892.1 VWA domain-containing protein [Thermococcus sp. GR7]NJE78783.1 VWA domain-containing protein [Thermococcus sp. GR4]NJF22087.1 VWA domain-containing protein [Thermococcus sp. GR5]